MPRLALRIIPVRLHFLDLRGVALRIRPVEDDLLVGIHRIQGRFVSDVASQVLLGLLQKRDLLRPTCLKCFTSSSRVANFPVGLSGSGACALRERSERALSYSMSWLAS